MDKHSALRIIRKIRADYNTIAKEWDASRFEPSPRKLKFLKSLKKGQAVLDIGCGNGLIIPAVLAKKVKYYGIDISDKLIAIARKKYKKFIIDKTAFLAAGEATELPFKKNSFDLAVSFSVFHHIPTSALRIKALKEIRRVLKPGGKAIISVWNLFNPWPYERFGVKEQVKNIPKGVEKNDVFIPWKATKRKKPIMRYLHAFDRRELNELARKAGFTKIKIYYQNKKGEMEKNGEDLSLVLRK